MTLFLVKDKKGFTLIELMITFIIIGILSAIILNFVFSIMEKSHIATVKSDLLSAYKISALYHIDSPDDIVDLNILRSNGYSHSKNITINIVDGSMKNLLVTATHPGVNDIYKVIMGGHISKQ